MTLSSKPVPIAVPASDPGIRTTTKLNDTQPDYHDSIDRLLTFFL